MHNRFGAHVRQSETAGFCVHVCLCVCSCQIDITGDWRRGFSAAPGRCNDMFGMSKCNVRFVEYVCVCGILMILVCLCERECTFDADRKHCYADYFDFGWLVVDGCGQSAVPSRVISCNIVIASFDRTTQAHRVVVGLGSIRVTWSRLVSQ